MIEDLLPNDPGRSRAFAKFVTLFERWYPALSIFLLELIGDLLMPDAPSEFWFAKIAVAALNLVACDCVKAWFERGLRA